MTEKVQLVCVCGNDELERECPLDDLSDRSGVEEYYQNFSCPKCGRGISVYYIMPEEDIDESDEKV